LDLVSRFERIRWIFVLGLVKEMGVLGSKMLKSFPVEFINKSVSGPAVKPCDWGGCGHGFESH